MIFFSPTLKFPTKYLKFNSLHSSTLHTHEISNYLTYNSSHIDHNIFLFTKPAIIHHFMVPFVGLVDSFWVSKLSTPFHLAAIGYADNIFFTTYSLFSFIPTILTPTISHLYAQDNNDEIKNNILISCILTTFLSLISLTLFFKTSFVVNCFLDKNTIIYEKTIDYLKIRSLSIPFALFNSLIFSIFRGMDFINSAIKINLLSQLLNLVLDPFMMIKYNIKGVAFSSLLSDILCCIFYFKLLLKKISFNIPIHSFKKISINLFKLGAFVQSKYLLINILYLTINKQLLIVDATGIQLAAHILLGKFLSINNILYRSLSTCATTLIPKDIVLKKDKITKQRLYFWTNILAIIQSILFIQLGNIIHLITKDPKVILICKKIILTITAYQYIDGINTVQEGILQGYQKFKISSIANVVTLIPLILILKMTTNIYDIWNLSTSILLLKTLYLFKRLKS